MPICSSTQCSPSSSASSAPLSRASSSRLTLKRPRPLPRAPPARPSHHHLHPLRPPRIVQHRPRHRPACPSRLAFRPLHSASTLTAWTPSSSFLLDRPFVVVCPSVWNALHRPLACSPPSRSAASESDLTLDSRARPLAQGSQQLRSERSTARYNSSSTKLDGDSSTAHVPTGSGPAKSARTRSPTSRRRRACCSATRPSRRR